MGGLSGGATSSFGYNPSENTYRNYEFRVFITSATTGYVELYVDGTFHATANNLTFGGTSGQNINGFAMYGSDMWDGSSNDDGFFEGTTVRNNGSVNLGYSLASGTFTPGVVSDGLAANSTTATSANSVNIGGNSGTSVILNQNNTYTGATTVNANATASAQHANAFGTTAGGVSVTSGGRVQMSGGITIGNEALTLNGDGISGSGALQNVSGNNTWSGNITNNGGARINADSGTTLTLGGTIASGANNFYIGGSGNTTINGTISGTATTGNGALYKDGSGTLTLTNNNSGLTGLVRLLGGTISVTNNNSLGSGTLELGGLATQAILQIGTNTSRNQTLLTHSGALVWPGYR